jgi:predicted RNase H-related nuclease YkuK (DUF458 family)
MVVVITDGLENASTDYTREKIKKMISHQEDVYKWQFIYIGADPNAYQEATSIGINVNSTVRYDKGKTVETYAVASTRMAQSRRTKEKLAFTAEDKSRVS